MPGPGATIDPLAAIVLVHHQVVECYALVERLFELFAE